MVERHKSVYGKAFTTPEFRVSYPSVFEAKADLQGDMFYSIQMLFAKGVDLSGFKAACEAIGKELGWEKGSYKIPLEDGNIKYNEDPLKNASLKDMTTSKAKSKNRPGLVDRLRKDINTPNEFFGGCYARASLVPKSYIVMGKKGVSLQLENLQKLRDGEPFGRVAAAAADVFDSVEYDDDDTKGNSFVD